MTKIFPSRNELDSLSCAIHMMSKRKSNFLRYIEQGKIEGWKEERKKEIIDIWNLKPPIVEMTDGRDYKDNRITRLHWNHRGVQCQGSQNNTWKQNTKGKWWPKGKGNCWKGSMEKGYLRRGWSIPHKCIKCQMRIKGYIVEV